MRKLLSIVKKCGSNEPDGYAGVGYEISRRSFLGSTALVVLPALCGGCTEDGVELVDLPAVSNNTIAIPLDDFPMLKSVGGSVVGRASGLANPIVIARVRDDMFAALDAI